MHSLYNIIYQINFSHPISGCTDTIKLSPTPDTIRQLKNYRLLFKQKKSSCYLLQSYDENEKPLIQIDSPIRLRFFILFDYINMVHYSDIELYSPNNFCWYIKNDSSMLDFQMIFSSENIIPIYKQIDQSKTYLTTFFHEELYPGQLSDGVYLENTPDLKPFGVFTIKNANQDGFFDLIIKNEESSISKKEINIIFNDRKAFLQFHIFDKQQNYNYFYIESNNSTIEFSTHTTNDQILIQSEKELTISAMRQNSFTLFGERKNGRKVTITERLAIPNIENLIKNKEKIFFTSFIYV